MVARWRHMRTFFAAPFATSDRKQLLGTGELELPVQFVVTLTGST